MSNLCIQVEDYVSPFAGQLPVVQTQDLIYIEKFEADAYGHWMFGVDSSSLVDRVNARSLTLQVGATIPPVYSANHVQLANLNGNALISDLVDAAATNITAVFIAKASTAGLHIIGGNLPPSASTAASGSGVFVSANKSYLNSRPLAANATGMISNVTSNQVFDQTNNVLIAISVNKTTKQCIIYTQQNGVESSTTSAYTGTYETSPNKISVGNGYYTAASGPTTSFVEAIIYDKALSVAELQAVATRAKLRQQNRGIAF